MKLDLSKITPKMITDAMACKDTEELKALLTAQKLEFEESDLGKLFDAVKNAGTVLSEDELENVAGGGCKKNEDYGCSMLG